MGIAVASVFAVSILTMSVTAGMGAHDEIPADLQEQIPLNSVNFVTNDHLKDFLGTTAAIPAQEELAQEAELRE